MITWKFENSGIFFKSTPENLERDILKMAHANSLPADTKIIILDGNTNNTLPTDDSGSNGSTPSPKFVPVSDSPEVPKTRKASSKLRDVPGDLDGSGIVDSGVSSTDNSVADSSASDWFDDQRV